MIINKFKKIILFFEKMEIISKYKIKGQFNVYGPVQLSNPNVLFGNNVTLYPGVCIWGNGKIVIGNNVSIGHNTIIFAKEDLCIGDDSSIAANCYIIDSNHSFDKRQLIRMQPLSSEAIRIGKDVWIGAGSTILKGSIISDGVVIGAMSLVNSSIESYTINVGIPSRTISERGNIDV